MVTNLRFINAQFTAGVQAAVFIVALDQKGRALFVSQKFDIPTACGRGDITCSSKVSRNFSSRMDSNLAKYIDKIDVYVDTRDSARSFRQRISDGIRETVKVIEDLPPEVKTAIMGAL